MRNGCLCCFPPDDGAGGCESAPVNGHDGDDGYVRRCAAVLQALRQPGETGGQLLPSVRREAESVKLKTYERILRYCK